MTVSSGSLTNSPGVHTPGDAISIAGLVIPPGEADQSTLGFQTASHNYTEPTSEHLRVARGLEFWTLEYWKSQILKGLQGLSENTESHSSVPLNKWEN